MSLLETIRIHVTLALKAGPDQEVKKTILRQVVSESQRLNVSSDDDICKIIRKLVEGNDEALRLGGPNSRLVLESEILRNYLPRTLSVQEVKGSLRAVAEGIKAAKSDGQAIGVAMKHFKVLGSSVNSKDVSSVVTEIRGLES